MRLLAILAALMLFGACTETPMDYEPDVDGPGPPPVVRFGTIIDGVWSVWAPSDSTIPPDTVGTLRPLAITWTGIPGTGEIRAYKCESLTRGVWFEGTNAWTEDLSDTIKWFSGEIPSDADAIRVMCVDDRFQSKPYDCVVPVNFDPDTELLEVTNRYWKAGAMHTRVIDTADGVPDTVSYRSWVRLTYRGWDDRRDSLACKARDTDGCIDFGFRYDRVSARVPGSNATSGWLPRGDVHDTRPASDVDSNSVNVGTVEYDLFAGAVDTRRRRDPTPVCVAIVGNFDPVLDALTVEDHFGNPVDPMRVPVDTLTWNFWRGEGWPYASVTDTIDVLDPDLPFIKTFAFTVRARGHDHPLDPDGSAIRAWRYLVTDDAGNVWPLGRSAPRWRDAAAPDVFEDVCEVTFRYPSGYGSEPADPRGDTVFANLPGYLGRNLTVLVRGRDTASEDEFEQKVTLNGEVDTYNLYYTGDYGRWTPEGAVTFHLRLVR